VAASPSSSCLRSPAWLMVQAPAPYAGYQMYAVLCSYHVLCAGHATSGVQPV
jgi:hypothetical protein